MKQIVLKVKLIFVLCGFMSVGILYAGIYDPTWPDYQGVTTVYYKDDNVFNVPLVTTQGSMTVYTDDIYNDYAPMHIVLENLQHYEYPYAWGLYYYQLPFMETTFKEFCRFWGHHGYVPNIWEYHAIWHRLENCSRGTGITVNYGTLSIIENTFAGLNSLEWFRVTSWRRNDSRKTVINKGVFRDCINLKYVEFDDDIVKLDQDIFLSCRKLEVIRFTQTLPTADNIGYIFHTDFNRTGADNFPKLKYIVVPDGYEVQYKENFGKVSKSVADGHTRVISETTWNRTPVTGIQLNRSRIIIKN